MIILKICKMSRKSQNNEWNSLQSYISKRYCTESFWEKFGKFNKATMYSYGLNSFSRAKLRTRTIDNS